MRNSTLAGLVTILIAAACTDPSPVPPNVGDRSPRVTATFNGSISTDGKRPKRANQLQYVGDAHNSALAEYFTGPFQKGTGLCTATAIAALKSKVLDVHRQTLGQQATFEVLKDFVARSECARARAAWKAGKRPHGMKAPGNEAALITVLNSRGPGITLAAFAPMVPLPAGGAAALVNQALVQVDLATSASDLDSRLAPIIDAAYALTDATQREVALASLAVAGSSAHYWEQNLTSVTGALQTSLNSNYGVCLANQAALPIEDVDPMSCFGQDPSGIWTVRGGRRPSPPAVRMTSASSAQVFTTKWVGCMEWFGLNESLSVGGIVKSDVKGALAGGIAGGAAGAATGAFAASAGEVAYFMSISMVCDVLSRIM